MSICLPEPGGCVPVSWKTFIHQILRKFFQPFWQIKQRVSPYVLVVSILFFFSISGGSCDGLHHSVLLELSLLVDAGCSATCNTDIGDAGAAELEELVDKPGTTIGT